MSAQRWLFGRDSYRPAGEVIRPSAYDVELLEQDAVAKAFVTEHHYSQSYPAARFRVGLYCRGTLVGVAVFSQARRRSGRFTRNIPENTFGMHVNLHDENKPDGTWCGAFNPSRVGEERPTVCSADGASWQVRANPGFGSRDAAVEAAKALV